MALTGHRIRATVGSPYNFIAQETKRPGNESAIPYWERNVLGTKRPPAMFTLRLLNILRRIICLCLCCRMSGNIMRIIYQINKHIAKKLRSSSSSSSSISSLFTSITRQQRSAARQMSNIYRLETQGALTFTCCWMMQSSVLVEYKSRLGHLNLIRLVEEGIPRN